LGQLVERQRECWQLVELERRQLGWQQLGMVKRQLAVVPQR